MKKSLQLLLFATALASLAGCSKFDDASDTPNTGNGKLIKIYAGLADDKGTRANINVGESVYTADWEAGDALGIVPLKTGGTATTASEFTYNVTESAFEGTLPGFETGTRGNYLAFFPHATITGTTANIPFGNLRSLVGNDFNSNFDALVATPAPYTEADTEAGKINGQPVAFKLHRLTSILNYTIGGSKTDKAKYLLLTSGTETQKLSAASLDFALETGGASTLPALSATDQSNVIALAYEAGSEPAANAIDALINIPAGNYDNLTLDVITEDKQIGTVSLQRNDVNKPFVAGTLYKKEVADIQFAPIAAPTLVWPEEDGKKIGEVHDITTDETGMSLNYSAAVNITVPGGIAGLKVDITSPALNAIGITTLDIFNETAIPGLNIAYGDLGLSCAAEVQYKKSCVFNITNLVPLILVLEDMVGADNVYCQHTFNVTVTDLAGQSTTQALIFDATPKIALASVDLWANTATLTLKSIPADATTVSVQYKKSTETTWQNAEVSSDKKTASIKPEWEDKTTADWSTPNTVLPYSRINAGTGIFAGNTYDYKLTIATKEYTGQFTTTPGDIIPGSDLENTTLPCFTQSGSESSTFWGSGNNSYAKTLCSPATFNGMGGNHCAKLAAAMAGVDLGIIKIMRLAAGNLFTGTFKKPTTTGFVNFGQEYTFTARPTALKVKYHAKVGIVDENTHSGPLAKNANVQDKARIFVCIVDWDKRHEVTSGTSAPTGIWDPETITNPGEGDIIGYGSLFIDQSTTGDSMVETELKINYYDKVTQPSKTYKLVISCATSAYGDYMNGCSTNELYVDDFEWVY